MKIVLKDETEITVSEDGFTESMHDTSSALQFIVKDNCTMDDIMAMFTTENISSLTLMNGDTVIEKFAGYTSANVTRRWANGAFLLYANLTKPRS